ncbi:MAG: TIGR03936 family radical SAM-associated protein [Lachnospiraceae bacterium]|nr:TIGR03936 family radical SAM-associated protein [Lachnospiraceae bacterium]
MIVRVKFSKYGFTKFIGHLDVVRYFQKAIRRSGLAVMYSGGFSPHQLLYFAAPLGLGQTSDGEYMDMELMREYSLKEIKERLNASMSEGFFVQSVTRVPDWQPGKKKESLMSLTACADYMVSVKDVEVDGKDYAGYFTGFNEKFAEFMQCPEIMVEKESKKSVKTMDIRPLIFSWGFKPEDISGDWQEGIRHAEIYENGLRVFLKLSSGSVDNLKPELVMESFLKAYGLPYRESALQFHRMELYCDLGLAVRGGDMAADGYLPTSGMLPNGRRLVPFGMLHTVKEWADGI